MRIFFFNIEHYTDYREESQNYLARLPIINSGVCSEHYDHVHQRDLRSHGRQYAEDQAIAALRRFRPDVVVYFQCWRDEDVTPRVFEEVRALGARLICFIWDSNLYPRWNEIQLFRQADCLLIVDSIDAYLRWRLLAEIYDPNKTIALGMGLYDIERIPPRADQRLYDVTLLGSLEGQRVALFDYLKRELNDLSLRFHVFGGLVNESQEKAAWVSWQDYDRIIRSSKLCLCSQTAADRVQVKGKIFEIIARGTLCLSDENPETRRVFPSSIVPLFKDPADCVRQIRHSLENEIERERIAAGAQEWFYRHFDGRNFFRQLLLYIVQGTGRPPTLDFLEDEFDKMHASRFMLLPILADSITTLVKFSEARGDLPGADERLMRKLACQSNLEKA